MASHFLPCKEPSPDGSPPTPERDLVTLAQGGCLHPAQGQRQPGVWSTDSVQAESEICLNMCPDSFGYETDGCKCPPTGLNSTSCGW